MGKDQTISGKTDPGKLLSGFWQYDQDSLFDQLESGKEGLDAMTARERLQRRLNWKRRRPNWWRALVLFLSQFRNPLILLLVFAVGLSASLGDLSNSIIILSILLLSGTLGFWQSYKADKAVRKLQQLVHSRALVCRAGKWISVLSEEIVPGDVIRLAAGDLPPGDGVLLTCRDLHMNEAALTGESFPVEKHCGVTSADAPVQQRTNVVFQGSNVVNGEAEALVVRTGADTELGRISAKLGQKPEATAFERGIDQLGYFLIRLTFLLAAGILIFNLFLHKPVTGSILFSLALAVGIAPELLPIILVATLSAGAERMAKKQVIVKKLSAIQNLGAVNILCSDKTGTLTTGEVKVFAANGLNNLPSGKTRLFAWLNAFFETGFYNPLDDALRGMEGMELNDYLKLDEVPYDFIRKRLSVVVEKDGRHIMITKGALLNVLEVCHAAEDEEGHVFPLAQVRHLIMQNFKIHSAEGFRTIAVAWKDVTGDPVIDKTDERGMTFLGFIFLYDPPKPDIPETIRLLKDLGIGLKIITGDNHLVARHLALTLGIRKPSLVTGAELRHISDEALPEVALRSDLFAEIEPNQKDRIIRALQRAGHVVGYLGDGINDATALRQADVGISVDSAADVAKEASDMILLEKDLNVLASGILEGRKTYLNTLKYIFVTTSANFGNMFSLAGISLFLRWLPLLPQQILLLNFFSDIPALGIAADRVDEDQLRSPKRWDLKLIRRFMTVFGLQSSLFDYLTFGLLLLVFHVDEGRFQSGWFLESVLTEIIILFIIRTVHPVWKSRPAGFLVWAGLLVAMTAAALPFLSIGRFLGFEALPATLLAGMIGVALLYGIMAETTKRVFFAKFNH
ncbi:MAG: magnesium-translocating P-type ATPase [Lewinella sp.]|nr:magnesium-translocating P-type ATPase [Lewinella sp.]